MILANKQDSEGWALHDVSTVQKCLLLTYIPHSLGNGFLSDHSVSQKECVFFKTHQQ